MKKAIADQDALLIKKAKRRLKKINPDNLIPIEDAFREAALKKRRSNHTKK